MAIDVFYPELGRGAWRPVSIGGGAGGTVNAKGDGPGQYFRSTVVAPNITTVGLAGFRALRDRRKLTVDELAVHLAVKAIQVELAAENNDKTLTADGIWGAKTDAALRYYQGAKGLVVDGIFGKQSSVALFDPLVVAYADTVTDGKPDTVLRIMRGTINLESVWDPAAVGRGQPQDLGLAQINGPSHPTMDEFRRFNPRDALLWLATFIRGNLSWAMQDVELAVAAYNLGRKGAGRWNAEKRPAWWSPTGDPEKQRDVAGYIDKVLNPE